MQTFLVRHTLSCPNGVIVIARHSEVRDKTIYLERQDFPPNCVRVKPPIHLGRSRSEEEVRHGESSPETWNDVSIQGL